jgi:hypothetical protein
VAILPDERDRVVVVHGDDGRAAGMAHDLARVLAPVSRTVSSVTVKMRPRYTSSLAITSGASLPDVSIDSFTTRR